MKLVLQNIKGRYKEVILGPLFKLFEAILELLVPIVVANMIDAGIANGDKRYLITRGLLLVLLAILGFGAAFLCQYYAAVAGGHFGRSLRRQTFSHVMKLSGADLGEIGAGGLITRLTNDINQIQNGLNMVIRLGTRAPFLAIGSIIMAMMMDFKIGLLFLVSTPLIVLVLYVIMKRTLPSYRKIQAGQDKLSRLSEGNLEGVRVIRAFSRQTQEQAEYEAAADALTALTVRVGKISAALNPLTTLIVNIAIALIVWVGAGFVDTGNMETGTVFALVSYMNQTLLALVVAANLIVLFTRAVASARRVEEVLEMQPSVTAGAADVQQIRQGFDGAVAEMKHVCFAYHAGAENVIEDISFSILPGQMVGLIGGTGSGKTTLVNLLLRYFDTQSGSVQFGGSDVKNWNPAALRRQIGLVPQKAVLFSGTIRSNLQMSAPGASEEQLWQALKAAQGMDFVKDLKDRLDASVEEGGKNFSGGQRQRLTIARALVRKSRLLILDDASSALDYATDAALRGALAQEMQENPGMAVLMITQRAAAIRNADQILVLDDGRLAGIGTHDGLLAENPVYREICQSQGLLAAAAEKGGAYHG